MALEAGSLPRRIVLIGLPGSGKSAVAAALAAQLGWQAVDCDELIVRDAGLSIPDIFLQHGEARFRQLERETIERVTALERAAIATGGGAVLLPENRERLWRDAFVVALQGRPATLLGRIAGATGPAGGAEGSAASRPLLSGPQPLQRLQELAAARAPLYGLADWAVPTDELSPEEVAAEIVRAYRTHSARLVGRAGRMEAHRGHEGHEVRTSADDDVAATVRTPSGDYPIVVGWDALAGLGARLRGLGVTGTVRVVTDEHVGALHAHALLAALAAADYETRVFILRPGEDHKTLADAEPVFDWLIADRAERREAILAFGGGVVTDLAGFVAATFLRGVPLVHVPTSLLGMVDAAIGGKVAVDHPLGKNLIGAFYQPKLVLIDAALLRTLPARELTSGWAEVIKHGLIADEGLVRYMEERADAVRALDPAALLPVLRRSVDIKAAVVSADERESGLRSTLNYGHTIGHALEAAEGYRGPLHGEAVAVGMGGAGEIARRLGLLPADDLRRQNRLIAAYGLPLDWPGADLDRIFAAMTLDKKIVGASIRWVLLNGIGSTTGRSDVPAEMVREIVSGLVDPVRRAKVSAGGL